MALEKAVYESGRARRQYDAVDPENRLVAAELESRWNDAIERQQELERRLADEECCSPSVEENLRERLLRLGDDLPATWHHSEAPVDLKKRILRTVLTEIMVDVADDPPELQMWLHWQGGVHTKLCVPKNRTGKHRRCTDRKVVDLVRELAKVCSDAKIASILNRLGYRTGTGNTWVKSRVRSLRSYHKIATYDAKHERYWLTLADTAKELGICAQSVRKLIQREILSAKQIVTYAPWVIERRHLELPAVQEAAKAIREGRRVPRRDPRQLELPLK